MALIDLFETCITGDFDNQQQVDAELKAGKQIHPLAKHVNRNANSKIRNAPQRPGFWLLEESYYTTPGKDMSIKPYLFFFEPLGTDKVQLRVYQLPADVPVASIRNDNTSLFFDYNTLKPSPTFKGAEYTYAPSEGTFSTRSLNDLGNGMRFTLIERFTKDRLEVMELLEKDGKKLTSYDTPILYDRKQ
jgi:hypothetical protein